MKGNTDKCHLILSTNEQIEIQVGESDKKQHMWKIVRCQNW